MKRQIERSGRVISQSAVLLGLLLCLMGCSRFKPKPPVQWVYVSAKQGYLRDRVAAVSNRTATVVNGDKLQVLDRGRRFLKVQTAKGELGWIDEKQVANEQVYGLFDTLTKEHKDDAPVASALAHDEAYLHSRPGKDTERFFLLAEGTKLKMLRRATLPKPLPPGAKPAKAVVAKSGEVEAPPPVAMEDWWLVRDEQGHTGWIYSRLLDVDAPETLTRYAEGQRIVGAYVLTTVHDEEADAKDVPADRNAPIYVAVMNPYKAGLPYDFDQVRVFTWSLKKHRYETGFRDSKIQGYLPVTIEMTKDPNGKNATAGVPAPTFSYRVLAAEAPTAVPDPVTGAVVPAKTVTKTYRMEGNLVRRVLQPGMPAPMEAKTAPEVKKVTAKGGKGKAKKR